MERQPISREGHEKIREEIRVLEDVEMPSDVTERIKTAREEGDLKENAEYHDAREKQGYLQAKINQLKSKLAGCYIVEKSEMPKVLWYSELASPSKICVMTWKRPTNWWGQARRL